MELREAVYYISQIRGLSFLCKLAYLFYYRLLSFLFWLTPEIRSLYIAGSMASGDFVPGLSDMDFILVIEEMSSEDEYRFLKRMNKKIAYLMPPFGKEKIGTHLFIYSSEEWALFGDLILGKSFASVHTIFEKGNIILKKKYDQLIKGLHHFYKGQWRIEFIQQNLSLSTKSSYSQAFLERAIEKCVLSIIYGFYESTQGLFKFPYYTSAQSRINSIANQIRESKNKDSLDSIFLKLIHLFHSVIENVYQSNPSTEYNGISEFQKYDDINIQKLRTKELVDEISGVLQKTSKKHSILVSRTENFDHFLFDLQNYEISYELIEYYRNRHRVPRMFSKVWFEKFYLSLPGRPIYFVDLHDGTQKIFKRHFDNARFIIEAYSIFPKVRSPKNFNDPVIFESIQNQLLQLIKILKVETELNKGNERLESHLSIELGNNITADNEYERFNRLKTMSLVLRQKVSESFSSLS